MNLVIVSCLPITLNLNAQTPQKIDSVFVDPICKMKVSKNSVHFMQHQNNKIRFCSSYCKEKFAQTNTKTVNKN